MDNKFKYYDQDDKKRQTLLYPKSLDTIIRFNNWSMFTYIIFSLLIGIFIFVFDTKMPKFSGTFTKLIITNIFSLLILSILILISYAAAQKKSISYLLLYLILLILFSINCHFDIIQILHPPKINNTAYIIFTLMILLSNLILTVYLAQFYISSNKYSKLVLEHFPVNDLINEIKVRTDLMKISFNNFIISLKLHKFCPGILFKRNDYYFTDPHEDFPEVHYESKTLSKEKSVINDSAEFINSKSTIDSEYELLK
jgi:hypothetical protein